jgi:hypothetical protein
MHAAIPKRLLAQWGLLSLLEQVGSCTEGSAKALEERGHGMRVMFDVTDEAHHAPKQP